MLPIEKRIKFKLIVKVAYSSVIYVIASFLRKDKNKDTSNAVMSVRMPLTFHYKLNSSG